MQTVIRKSLEERLTKTKRVPRDEGLSEEEWIKRMDLCGIYFGSCRTAGHSQRGLNWIGIGLDYDFAGFTQGLDR